MTTTRQRILTEATTQLLDRGYHAFTMARVRDTLGLSSGSMFHAFASKPELAAAVFVEGMRDYHYAAGAALTSATEPGDAIAAWIEAHLRWVQDRPRLARFLFSTQPEEVMEAAAPALADANAAFYKVVHDVNEDAAAAGMVAPMPLTVFRSLVMGPVQEYCRHWTRTATGPDPLDLAAMYSSAARAAMHSTLPSPNGTEGV